MANRRLEFDTKEPISTRERLLIIGLYEEGKTDVQVAKILGISKRTLRRMIETADLMPSIKNIKLKPDKLVELSLYQRARGFNYIEEKRENIELFDKEAKIFVPATKVTKTRKFVPPDTTACIYWTKNRDPERWRDKFDHEIGGNIYIKV